MRFLLSLIVALGILNAFAAAHYAVTKELVDMVNSNPESSWKAEMNHFSRKTVEEAKRLLKTAVHHKGAEQKTDVAKVNERASLLGLPASFDGRQQWPDCIHPVRNQQQCGSCWAFSAAGTLSDRFCIFSKGQTNVVLAPGDLVGCDNADMGCNGGMLDTAWQYMEYSGVAVDSCIPYTSGNGTTQACPSSCADGSAIKRYHASGAAHIDGGIFIWTTVSKIQQAVMEGPVQAAFSVYQDFLSYKSGIYVHTSGELLGGHAVEIVGWGTDSKLGVYWIIKNSWSDSWGMNGYFNIAHNQCGISSDVWTGKPVV